MARNTSAPQRPIRPRTAIRWSVAALLFLALFALLYPEPFLGGKIYGSSDAENANAYALAGNEALGREHEGYPLWNPYVFTGLPTFTSMSYTRFAYPPGELFNLLQNHLGFPPMTWVFGHLLLGALGMYWLLGRLGLPPAARVLGAVIWLCFPKTVAWTVHGHGSKLCAAMYLPWITGAAWQLMAGRGRWHAGLLALMLGLQILLGHMQITYYSLMVVGLLLLADWAQLAARRGRVGAGALGIRSGLLIGGVLVGMMIAAFLLLPVREYAAWSIRGAAEGGGASYAFATGWSLSPRELATLIMPAAAGFGKATYQGTMPIADYPNYLGLLPLALAVCAFFTERRRTAIVFALIAGLALLVSFGKHFPPLYDLFYNLLPYFNKFRVPSMILSLTAFAAAILAAMGARRLAGDDAPTRLATWLPRILAGMGLLLLIGGAGLFEGVYRANLGALASASGKPEPLPIALSAAWSLHKADLLRIGILLIAAGGALFAAGRSGAFRRHGLIWTLCLLAVIDYAAVDRRVTHPETGLRQYARTANGGYTLVRASGTVGDYDPQAGDFSDDPYYRALAERIGHDRVWPVGAAAMSNAGMSAGFRSLGGYHPAKPAAFEQVRTRLAAGDDGAVRLAGWLGARLVWNGQEMQDLPWTLPRARLVDAQAPAVGELGDFLDGLAAGRIDPTNLVHLEEAPDPAPVGGTDPLPPVEYLYDGMDAVQLRATTPRPAILVLSDLWLPGWTATVDGEPVPLLKADHMLRAVALPAGTHTVEFAYTVPRLRPLLWVSLLGLGLAIISILEGTLRRPRGGIDDREKTA